MATYKVIQDIEAEDKFVGPLTLKQFIFACITVVLGYLSFLLLTKNLWYIAMVFLPAMLFFGFLAFPWGRDQPTEVWLLAKVRFFFKPHLRKWDQGGVQELVTITAPKHPESQYMSDNLSQTEVKSRLKALADTIDSRGWVVKNVTSQPPYAQAGASSDRLIDIVTPQEIPAVNVRAEEDILDERNNPVAQHLNDMITSSTQTHRQETLDKMQKVRESIEQAEAAQPQVGSPGTTNDLWFMNQPTVKQDNYATFGAQAVNLQDSSASSTKSTALTAEEAKLLKHVHEEQTRNESATYGHMRVVKPLSDKQAKAKAVNNREQSTSTKPPDPAILELAHNDDLTVATIARQMNKKGDEPPDNEVVVSLH